MYTTKEKTKSLTIPTSLQSLLKDGFSRRRNSFRPKNQASSFRKRRKNFCFQSFRMFHMCKKKHMICSPNVIFRAIGCCYCLLNRLCMVLRTALFYHKGTRVKARRQSKQHMITKSTYFGELVVGVFLRMASKMPLQILPARFSYLAESNFNYF